MIAVLKSHHQRELQQWLWEIYPMILFVTIIWARMDSINNGQPFDNLLR